MNALVRRLIPQTRAQWAWCLYDWANSAFATSVLAVFLPVYFAKVVVPSSTLRLSLGCFSWESTASSLWAYTISASLFLVTLSAPIIGRIADRTGSRKLFLLILAYTGAFATMALITAVRGAVFRTLGVFSAAYLCFSASEIFYNGYLPHVASKDQQDWLSGLGYAYGYVGGGLLLGIHLILVAFHSRFGFESTSEALRIIFASVGLWWAVFSLPLLFWLPAGRHAPSPSSSRSGSPGFSFRHIRALAADLRSHPSAALMVLAYFFYNNGIQTVIAMASIYAATTLNLSTTCLAGAFLMTQWIAFPGAVMVTRLAEGWGTRRTLIGTLVLWCAVVLAAFGMRSSWQFWVLAACIGFVLGGTQALSRSLFSGMIPRDKSAQFFGFFATGGKFSALLGPFVFGVIQDATGNPRWAILSVLIFFLVGLALLRRLPSS